MMAAAKSVVGEPYRVMVVDDSAVIRGLISRWLNEDPFIKVVYSACNGKVAVAQANKSGAELIVLDIEMPEMDGLTALPKILKEAPDVKIIMASTLTRRNADITLRALSMGAADYIPKPESTRTASGTADFQREIIEKIKTHGANLRNRIAQRNDPAAGTARTGQAEIAVQPAAGLYGDQKIVLRRLAPVAPGALGVGSSTGGPQALVNFFESLRGKIHVPVFVTQHMPATFTSILAEHIGHAASMESAEGVDGEPVVAGRIYVAPGDYHMAVAGEGGNRRIKLNQKPPINFCRPSVDPMFSSLSTAYRGAVLGVILTGMGHDGLEGSRDVVKKGGSIFAQDEQSSVVWGMPGAVATNGLCSKVLPLRGLGGAVARFLNGARP